MDKILHSIQDLDFNTVGIPIGLLACQSWKWHFIGMPVDQLACLHSLAVPK